MRSSNFKHPENDSSCTIQIRDEGLQNRGPSRKAHSNCQTMSFNTNFSAINFLNRLRKVVVRFMFIVPPAGRGNSHHHHHQPTVPRQHVPSRRSCEWRRTLPPDTPKVLCTYNSSSSNSHYTEAIADCIEFLNKSSNGGLAYNSRISDALV